MCNRRDKCKCGMVVTWKTSDSLVTCKYCQTKYTVEADSVLVYWLEEIVDKVIPYRTDAR